MNHNSKETKLYNILFPIWALIMFPIGWIIVMPANFLIDSLVLLISLKALKLTNIIEYYKKMILKVWFIGFASDFFAAFLLYFVAEDNTFKWYEYLRVISWNPLDNWYALISVGFAVLLSGILIYLGNLRITFKESDLSRYQKRILALILAVITAPYILFYPSCLLYDMSWDEIEIMTNHIIHYDQNHITVVVNDYPGNPIRKVIYTGEEIRQAINTAEKLKKKPSHVDIVQPDFTITSYDSDSRETNATNLPVWIDSDQDFAYFIHNNQWYTIDLEKEHPFILLNNGN